MIHTYGNTSATDYGVNNDGSGNLSGYAWGTNVGWINFNPSHSQVTIDPATGGFDGYVWGENIGWIHFKGTGAVAYHVATDWKNFYYHLPVILKAAGPPAPDLAADDLVATSSAVTVTIRNAGTAAVNDAFWVDVYFNPSQTPSLNQPWDTIGSHGVVWGVTDPIPAGGSLVLTTGGQYYFGPPDSSAPPLPVGVDVYALVDSVGYGTAYGAVPETDEGNNLFGPAVSGAGAGSKAAPGERTSCWWKHMATTTGPMTSGKTTASALAIQPTPAPVCAWSPSAQTGRTT